MMQSAFTNLKIGNDNKMQNFLSIYTVHCILSDKRRKRESYSIKKEAKIVHK